RRERLEQVLRGAVDEPLGGAGQAVPAGPAAHRTYPAHRTGREYAGPAGDRVVRRVGEGREAVAGQRGMREHLHGPGERYGRVERVVLRSHHAMEAPPLIRAGALEDPAGRVVDAPGRAHRVALVEPPGDDALRPRVGRVPPLLGGLLVVLAEQRV